MCVIMSNHIKTKHLLESKLTVIFFMKQSVNIYFNICGAAVAQSVENRRVSGLNPAWTTL